MGDGLHFAHVSHTHLFVQVIAPHTCYNGQCIDATLACNRVFDCNDGSDESRCTCELGPGGVALCQQGGGGGAGCQ